MDNSLLIKAAIAVTVLIVVTGNCLDLQNSITLGQRLTHL